PLDRPHTAGDPVPRLEDGSHDALAQLVQQDILRPQDEIRGTPGEQLLGLERGQQPPATEFGCQRLGIESVRPHFEGEPVELFLLQQAILAQRLEKDRAADRHQVSLLCLCSDTSTLHSAGLALVCPLTVALIVNRPGRTTLTSISISSCPFP